MRFLALGCICANMNGARALGQIRDLLAPKLLPGEICLSGAGKFVVA